MVNQLILTSEFLNCRFHIGTFFFSLIHTQKNTHRHTHTHTHTHTRTNTHLNLFAYSLLEVTYYSSLKVSHNTVTYKAYTSMVMAMWAETIHHFK